MVIIKKFWKRLIFIFAIVFTLGITNILADSYLVMNQIWIAKDQGESSQFTDKSEISYQYIKNTSNSSSRGYRARLMGKNILGNDCYTTHKYLPLNTWTTLGNENTTIDGCGSYPVSGKAFVFISTNVPYSTSSSFWGTWITDASLYNQYISLYG